MVLKERSINLQKQWDFSYVEFIYIQTVTIWLWYQPVMKYPPVVYAL